MAEINSSGTIRTECPFFKSHSTTYISCESALCENGYTKHGFRTKKQKDKFMRNNCCKDRGEGCLYYNAIMLKYEQE